MKIVDLPKGDSEMEKFARELPKLIQASGLIAQIRKGLYDAYIKEGFTKEEALELCKVGYNL
jgi:hypothetical protein